MIVKVCGVRTAEVATTAVEAGADWIGLVFEPRSPRYVDPAAATEVIRAVAGAADVVGVVVSPSPRQCQELAERYGLAAVQVHGPADPGLVLQVSVPVIRAVNAWPPAPAAVEWWPDCLILLDAAPGPGELPGGTGRRLPLEWAASVAAHRPIVLAGGLGPEDVADAVARVRPVGVDASSRLELAVGVKDLALVRAFVRAARAAAALVEAADPPGRRAVAVP